MISLLLSQLTDTEGLISYDSNGIDRLKEKKIKLELNHTKKVDDDKNHKLNGR